MARSTDGQRHHLEGGQQTPKEQSTILSGPEADKQRPEARIAESQSLATP